MTECLKACGLKKEDGKPIVRIIFDEQFTLLVSKLMQKVEKYCSKGQGAMTKAFVTKVIRLGSKANLKPIYEEMEYLMKTVEIQYQYPPWNEMKVKVKR